MTARCPVKACPVRYASGPDRDCGGHDNEDTAAAALALGINLRDLAATAPGDRDGDGRQPPSSRAW